MAEKMPQTYANHKKLDPSYHYFLSPVLLVTVFVAIWNLVENPGLVSAWLLLVSVAAVVANFKLRGYSLKVQNRVIRLEERLRLSLLLAEPLRSRIGELSERQLVALRFAPDAEIPTLVEKTLSGKLSNAEIKKQIVNWRPDYMRV